MEDMIFCQSCAMPLNEPEYKGTNSDGSLNEEYCIYCYKDGGFAQDCSMDEMIEHCLAHLNEFNADSEVKFTEEEARAQMKEYFPLLKRWAK